MANKQYRIVEKEGRYKIQFKCWWSCKKWIEHRHYSYAGMTPPRNNSNFWDFVFGSYFLDIKYSCYTYDNLEKAKMDEKYLRTEDVRNKRIKLEYKISSIRNKIKKSRAL